MNSINGRGSFDRRYLLKAGAGAAVLTTSLGRAVSRASAMPAWDSPAPEIPETRSTTALKWCLRHINSGGADLSTRDLEAHVSPEFLAALPATDLLAIFTGYFVPNAPMTIARLEGAVRDDFVQAILTTPGADWRVVLGVDPDDLIDSLFFTPVYLPVPPMPAIRQWSEIKPKLRSIAPMLSFQVVERKNEHWSPIYELNPNRTLGIGSSFKLYVLAELSRRISAGESSWDELLEIRDDLRSLPNGDMRLEPAGAAFPIRHFAEQMIAASDNTATDHLITRLGREAAETAFRTDGNAKPERNVPLLLTREWFAIKLRLSKKEIEAYIKADVDKRRSILQTRVDPEALTLTEEEDWPGSYYIEDIEWFASASDLNRVMAKLHAMSADDGLAPISESLSKNPGISFDARTWSYVGYKGGYETGVKSDVWLLQRGDGRWFGIAAIINDTKKEIDGIGLSQLMMPLVDLLARRD